MGRARGVGLATLLAVIGWAAWAGGQGPAGRPADAGPAWDSYAPPSAARSDGTGSAMPAGPQTVPSDPNGAAPLLREPTLQRRGPVSVAVPGVPAGPAAPPAPPVPFVLSPAQAAQLDQVLAAWERRNQEVKSFECTFTRFEYDYIFSQNPGQPRKLRDQGTLKYAAPDKGLYKIDGERSAEWLETAPGAGEWKKSKEPRDKQWICDGKSIFEYIFQVPPNTPKRRIEHPLPPDLQGKAISDGPLPFVFGTDARKLKERYWMKITTPSDVRGEIWLEAYPRLQKDTADFFKLDVILKTDGLLPDAIQMIDPNGKNREVYKFQNVVINRRSPGLRRIGSAPLCRWAGRRSWTRCRVRRRLAGRRRGGRSGTIGSSLRPPCRRPPPCSRRCGRRTPPAGPLRRRRDSNASGRALRRPGRSTTTRYTRQPASLDDWPPRASWPKFLPSDCCTSAWNCSREITLLGAGLRQRRDLAQPKVLAPVDAAEDVQIAGCARRWNHARSWSSCQPPSLGW